MFYYRQMTRRKWDEDTIVISSDEVNYDVEVFEPNASVDSSLDNIKKEDDTMICDPDEATSSEVNLKEQCEYDVSHFFKKEKRTWNHFHK